MPKLNQDRSLNCNMLHITRRVCILGLAALGSASQRAMAGRAVNTELKDTLDRPLQKANSTLFPPALAPAPSPSVPSTVYLSSYESQVGPADALYVSPLQQNLSASYQPNVPLYNMIVEVTSSANNTVDSVSPGFICADNQVVPRSIDFNTTGSHGPEEHVTDCLRRLLVQSDAMLESPLSLIESSTLHQSKKLPLNTYPIRPNQLLRIYTEILNSYKTGSQGHDALIVAFATQLKKKNFTNFLSEKGGLFPINAILFFQSALQRVTSGEP